MTDPLDPAQRFRHMRGCTRPPLATVTGRRGDQLATCGDCGRKAPMRRLLAALAEKDDEVPDIHTYDGDRRNLVMRCALKGIPVAFVDEHGALQVVRNLDDLAAIS